MAANTKQIKGDVDKKPSPQYYNPVADEYEYLYGENGASRHILYSSDGQPITSSGNKLAVRASEIETLLSDIKSKDFATQTTLAQILAKIIAAPATEAKQTALNTLIGEVQAVPTANTLLARLKNLETKVDAIIADGVKLSGSNVILDTKPVFVKKPTSRLIFDEFNNTRSLRPIAKSYVPGKSYGIDHGWVAVSEDAWETKTNGISFATQGNGICSSMVVWPDESICAITDTGKIVTMENINAAQVVTLETVGLVGDFADFYCDGLNRIVVAGEYTQGDSVPKNLYLSKDGGVTFETIKVGDTLGTTNNHWHGVCYDPYSGAIWAAQGDSENAKIYFSYDLGVTWYEVDAQGQKFQPTLIYAFPDKVIFGEDSNTQNPGLFTYKKIGNEQPTIITIERLLEFRTDRKAYQYYPSNKDLAEANSNEVYIIFKPQGITDKSYIYGTGDGGNTWHLVYVGNESFNAMQVIGDYLVCSKTSPPEMAGVWRAKLPNWI